jgi:hypothetical protein
MSYDLAVWYSPERIPAERAAELYKSLCAGDLSSIEPSRAIEAFVKELSSRYPQLDEVPDDQVDDSPWSCGFDVSDRHVLLTMSTSHLEEVGPFVQSLAEKHRLFLFDPQTREVYVPTSLPPMWELGEATPAQQNDEKD